MLFASDTLADRKADRLALALEVCGFLAPHQLNSQRFRRCRDTAECKFETINRHGREAVGLATLLGVGSELTITGESDLVQAMRESTQQNLSRAGDQLTSRNLNIQPTITIRPGASVRLVVNKDLILAPWRE
jgi:hypothetical protein